MSKIKVRVAGVVLTVKSQPEISNVNGCKGCCFKGHMGCPPETSDCLIDSVIYKVTRVRLAR